MTDEQLDNHPWKKNVVILSRVEEFKLLPKSVGADSLGLFEQLFEETLEGLTAEEVSEILDRLISK